MDGKITWRIFVGVGLIVLGIVSILQTFNIFSGTIWSVAFIVLFAMGGIGFLVNWAQNRERWWSLLPGFMLLGIAGTIALDEFTYGFLHDLTGIAFLGSAAIAFFAVYLTRRTYWWALIPGFVMAGLCVMIGIEESSLNIRDEYGAAIFLGSIALAFLVIFLINRTQWWALIPAGAMVGVSLLVASNSVSVLFLSLALTFALLGIIRVGSERMTWAFIPAAVLGVLAILFYWMDSGARLIGTLLVPGILIVVGAYLLIRVLIKR